MSELPVASHELKIAVARFNNALDHLEKSISTSVIKVAELARSAGYEEGKNYSESNAVSPDDVSLQVAKQREENLEAAILDARTALSEAIEDIRTIIGPV